jgi:hypothetical protein
MSENEPSGIAWHGQNCTFWKTSSGEVNGPEHDCGQCNSNAGGLVFSTILSPASKLRDFRNILQHLGPHPNIDDEEAASSA